MSIPANQIQMSGYSYDAAGNLTSDGLHTYTYDANGNIVAVDGGNTATYTYNALNQHVRIDRPGSDNEEFVYNSNGQPVSSFDVNQGWAWAIWTYWGSRRVAFYADGMTDFDHSDWEGTERMRTQCNGSIDGSFASLPLGDGYTVASGEDIDPQHFAMLDQDVNDNDHAMFREYSNMSGRWMSPDPYSGSYDLSNPQSFNRYAYVMNSPMGYVDPTGTDEEICAANGCYDYPDYVWYLLIGYHGPGSGISIGADGTVWCGAQICGTVSYIANPLPDSGPSTAWVGSGGPDYAGGDTAGGAAVAPSNAPSNSNYCSVLDPNCKRPGPVANYLSFLACEYNDTIEQGTDQEDGQGTNSPSATPAAKLTTIPLLVYGIVGPNKPWVKVTSTVTLGSIMIGTAAHANEACSPSFFGN